MGIVSTFTKEFYFRNPNFFIGICEKLNDDGTVMIKIIGETENSIRSLSTLPLSEPPIGLNSGGSLNILPNSIVYGIFLDEDNTTPIIIGYIPQIDYNDERFYNRRLENRNYEFFIEEINKIYRDEKKILNNPVMNESTNLDYIKDVERDIIRIYLEPPQLVDYLYDFVEDIMNKQDLLNKELNYIKNKLDVFIHNIISFIEIETKRELNKVINSVRKWARNKISVIVSRNFYGSSEIVNRISKLAYKLLNCIIGYVIDNVISDILSSILDYIKGCIVDIIRLIKSIIDSIFSRISSIINTIFNTVKRIFDFLYSAELNIDFRCSNEGISLSKKYMINRLNNRYKKLNNGL